VLERTTHHPSWSWPFLYFSFSNYWVYGLSLRFKAGRKEQILFILLIFSLADAPRRGASNAGVKRGCAE
jgi:hypothetical protein